VFLAILWGAFRRRGEDEMHSSWPVIRQATTIIMLITGVFFLWTGLTHSGIVPGVGGSGGSRIAAVTTAGGEQVENSGAVVWQRDYARAQQMAREQNLPIFVDFFAHWCANCKKFSHEVAEPGPLQDALLSVVTAKVYDTDAVFETFQNDPRYPELKRGLPFFLLLSPSGEFLWKGADYRAHETMIREIESAVAGNDRG
ncbi:MAG: thioredoxin family protein, partial [bacterium]